MALSRFFQARSHGRLLQSSLRVPLLSTLLLLAAMPAQAQEAEPCDEALARATTSYFDARFNEAISLLNRCISADAFSDKDEERAYTLLGKAYRSNDLEEQARAAIRELLTRVPSYSPNPATETPDFIAFIEAVRETMEVEGIEPPSPNPPPVVEPSTTPPDTTLILIQDPLPDDSTAVMAGQPTAEAPPPDPLEGWTPPKKKSGLTKWLAIGGGALVASVAVLVLAGGGDGGDGMPTPDPLPTPPSFPKR